MGRSYQNFLQVEWSFKIISRELWVPLPSVGGKIFIILFCFWPELSLEFGLSIKVTKLSSGIGQT